MVVAQHHLDDETNEASEEARDKDGAHNPDEDLAVYNVLTKIHIRLLLAGTKKPALLDFV